MTRLPAQLEPTEQWLAALSADPASAQDRDLAGALVWRGVAVGRWMRERPLATTRKTSVSDIVTEADHRAEADIVAALAALRPADGILGEEGAARASASGRTWIIDPVDGTYNYASRLGSWCSAIALRAEGDSLIGAVASGATGETWIGQTEGDGPGLLLHDGKPAPNLLDTALADIALTTYLHPTRMHDLDVIEPWLAASSGAATVRMLGSGSLDLAAVAAGRAGGFLQSGTADWDWYPGIALVRAAGGAARVVHHRGHRWHIAGPARVVADVAERLLGA